MVSLHRACCLRCADLGIQGGTSSKIPWRYAGYPVYQKGSATPYYFYKGVQETIDIKEVNMASERTPSEVHVEVPGHSTKPLNSPDRQVMALVDAMLGQSSCLNSPSQCAYRCFYNSDDDKCGPVAFCTEVAKGWVQEFVFSYVTLFRNATNTDFKRWSGSKD